jgi:subfamily B ATP-binding cassette protein MsbA
LLAVAGFLVGNAAEVYFARLIADVMEVWSAPPPNAAVFFPAMIMLTALLRGLGGVVGELFLSRISFHVVHSIRSELFNQLLVMPSGYFDRSSAGHLVSRITYNVAQLRDTGSDALKTLIQDGTKVVLLVVGMLYTSWKLTLIFIAITPLVALIAAFASKRFRRISEHIQGSMGDVTHVASEMVAGYRVVRIFGGERYEKMRFERASNRNRRQNLKMILTKASSVQIIQLIVASALALLVALLFNPLIGGNLSSGDVLFFMSLAGLLARPIKKLSEVNAKLQRGLAAAEDVFTQFDQKIEIDTGERSAANIQGKIEFRDVHFAYDDKKGPVLKGVSFSVDPGQTVALVGKSGGGKSTIISLIPRFYDINSGEILLDGVPIEQYSLPSLRSQIAIVNQQVVLFNDTLKQNIAYGALSLKSDADLRAAVLKAHAEEFIGDLPEGLETLVGDNGVLLSGGQRQRIAIARALLKNSPLLILDEATSALDNSSERHIQSALEEVMRNRTTIVIAHRLSTIEKADIIVVIDKGEVAEQGTHAELLARQGAYAQLYDSELADTSSD